ncbi:MULTISPECIES: RNA polymerase sigma factor [Novosphingobium]|uniref:RNA polymerase sigma-70 factor, ECF subfamily n=1 Tax=Novosphingobium mathurense TaxID=428990 RepID=A0A1U6I5K8_9SPHN|nr:MULTISPECIES: RNA polymerase sigma factor [Novosphingobium]CDO36585.1 RNA polymerase sigma-70 factor, ECF subfamily protein (modular protein) [Novosphingobium sp. KN65.2]SLK03287.1 RNA polymerase sigma-70 factor, ECF subfamily [Novosphingobium mathurense]
MKFLAEIDMEPMPQQPRASGLARVLEDERGPLLQFLVARCGSADDAQDLLQDLWIKVSAQPAGPVANPRAYLFRMANNLVLDRLRGRQRAMRRERNWLEAESGGVVMPPEDRTDPGEPADDALVRKQEAQILREAIDALPEGAGRALRLYRFEGMGQGEIAEVMGISRSGVEKHLALAMKRLRTALADCGCFDTATSTDRGADSGDRPHMEQGQ